MGKKVSPVLYRLGTITQWQSRWFSRAQYRKQLQQDYEIRTFLLKKYRSALLSRVQIDRSANIMTITLFVGRPGVVIGRGGAGVTTLQEELQKLFFQKERMALRLNVQEIRPPMADAHVVALTVAEQLEKRLPFRRVLKQTIEQVKEANGVQGVKIFISGRLNFAEMSRSEWLAWGKIPLHTLRANVDFAKAEAGTKVGRIGVKVWIYKGDVFRRPEEDVEPKEEDEKVPSRRRGPRKKSVVTAR